LTLTILAISFIVLIVGGTPIAFVLGLVALFHMFLTGNPLIFNMISQRIIVGIDNFSLMAIPFFMLAGELMNYGGCTKRLIKLANVLVGHLKGGLAYVNILASAFLAAIMGSAVAESAAIGSTMIPAMEKEGYEADFSAALTAASSTLGPVIPPSMVFIIYGITAGVSIGGMFFAGILPGIFLAFLFAIVTYFVSKKRKYPTHHRASLTEVKRALIEGGLSLFVPVIILGGICTGVFTATESAVIASIWALILGLFIYKEMKITDLKKIILNTCLSSSAIILIMANANIFGWTLAIEQIPQRMVQLVLSISDNPITILFLLNIFLLFVGCVMEGIASMIILVPVLLPIATKLGIDPVHFGIIVSYNLIIGLITPPIGLCLYSVSSISKVSIESIVSKIWPFLIASIITLFMVMYWEDFVMFIPRLIF